MNLVTWILIVINAIVASSQSVQPNFRLPGSVVPFHYKIKILTKLQDDFSYHGKVWIDVEALTDTDKVVLHSRGLKIYENETTIEGLSTSALESIFQRRRHGRSTDGSYENEEPDLDESLVSGDDSSPADSPIPETRKSNRKRVRVTTEKTQLLRGQVDESSSVISTKNSTESKETPQSVPVTPLLPVAPVVPVVPFVAVSVPKLTDEASAGQTTEGLLMPTPVSTEGLLPITNLLITPSTESSATDDFTTSSSPESPSMSETPITDIRAESFEYQKDNNFLIINLNTALRQGKKYRIQLRFKGVLSDTLTGFYRVSYKKRSTRKLSWLASTVFEPSEARSAFPCFDEPNYKATFDVALAHDKKFVALSNMPAKSTSAVEGRPDYQWTYFERTPRMSTYLVAFLISDLHHQTAKVSPTENSRNTTYRFWARQEVLQKTKYAAKIVPGMKNYMENLLGVQDEMPKLDFVALPSFISNALENWGLISFSESSLLHTPGFSSVFSKFDTTRVLAHEIAHMWFGNSITPKFWDQIWLSEGISNFFEIVLADHVQPNWDVKTISLVFSYLKLFSLDAMHSSHPLVPHIKNSEDVNEIFDSITYQKGFLIVRMLNNTLGWETFVKGLGRYATKYKQSNVEETDLWDCLTEQAHLDGTLPAEYNLRELMENWTRRTGYPIVDVYRDYENQTAVVTQRRFLRPKFDLELRKHLFTDENEPEDTKWWIPLTYTSGHELDFANTRPKAWMKPTEEDTVLTNMPQEDDFLLMNLDATGLYRVNYDERNWEMLVEVLLSENYSDISVINRVQLLDDLLDFARAGEVSYLLAFDATTYLRKEKHYLPWKAAFSNFDYILRMLRSTDSNRLFKKYMRSIVAHRFDDLGIEPRKDESIADAMNRKQVVRWACLTGHRPCTRKSLALFRKWSSERKPDENNPIPNGIRSVVYCTAVAQGGKKEWQFLWQRYLNNNDASDKGAVINALGCSRSARTLKKFLDWSLNESSGIKKQDTVAVFQAVAANDIGFALANDFLKTRIEEIRKYMGNNPFYTSQMIESLTGKMNRESHLEDLESLEEQHFATMRSIPRSLKQAKERVTFNIDWLDRNYNDITDWLKKQKF